PHTLPARYRTTGRARGDVLFEATGRSTGPVIVPGHDHYGLLAAWEIPETRQGLLVEVHLADEVREQALLLVGLRDDDLVQVDPVGLRIPTGSPVEQIIRTN